MGVKGSMVMSSMCLPSNRSQLGTNQNVQFLLAFLGVHLWAVLYTYYVKVKKKTLSRVDSNLLFPYITGNCYIKGYLEILHRNHAILLTCVCFTSSLFVANTFDATSYNQTDPTSSPANITEHAGTDIV